MRKIVKKHSIETLKRYGLPFVSAAELLAKRFGFKLEYEATGPLGFPQVELPLEAA